MPGPNESRPVAVSWEKFGEYSPEFVGLFYVRGVPAVGEDHLAVAAAEASETMRSSAPRTNSTSGRVSIAANALRSQYLGEKALTTPHRPGATFGQFGEGTLSPG